MKTKFFRSLMFAVAGMAYMGVVLLLSRGFIRCAGNLARFFAAFGGAETLKTVIPALEQLKNASIDSPWLLFLGGGFLLGGIWGLLIRRKKKSLSVLWGVLWVLLILPAALAALWLTRVNEIGVGHLIRHVWPLLLKL